MFRDIRKRLRSSNPREQYKKTRENKNQFLVRKNVNGNFYELEGGKEIRIQILLNRNLHDTLQKPQELTLKSLQTFSLMVSTDLSVK